MTNLICITGYIENAECGHCGRVLRHGIRTEAGTVGAQCFAQKITAPRKSAGKSYRLDAAAVVHIAKVVQRANPANWGQYGVSETGRTFEVAA